VILPALVALALAADPAAATTTAAAPEPAAIATASATPDPIAPSTTAPRGPRKVGGFLPPPVAMPAGAPRRVVLLLADGTPGKDDQAYAQALAADGALVAVLDTRAWLEVRAKAPRCAYPAGDLEVLAQQLEKERGLDAYQRPTVVGLGEGANVAWAAIAQGPAGTFAGAVLASPCPERPLAVKLCAVDGPRPRRLAGGDLPALAKVRVPAEVIAGPRGGCPAETSARLARDLGARLERVTPAGAGAGGDPAVAAALRAAVERLVAAAPPPAPAAVPAAPAPEGVSDLPVVELPAAGKDPRLAILITGDGGWVGIDKSLAAAFAGAGVATVGLDALKYFWKKRTPDETAGAIARIIRHYGAAWGRPEVILVGYSRGADLAPFIAARLGPAERARLRLVALLGPGTFAEFEVHAIDIFSNVRRDSALSTEDPLRATAGQTRFLCVHGADEKDSLCPHVEDLPWVKQVLLQGGHHFDGDYQGIARLVLEAARP
jgi:type IV secretory pathway VirJ component